jgi:uncharacterized membrane protein HdeD (DUF308 family)
MSATSVRTTVKKSVRLSIGLTVLMIVAGLLAISLPQVDGITANLLVAWLLVFGGVSRLMLSLVARRVVSQVA